MLRALWVATMLLAGCAHQTSPMRLMNAARELNVAARFGQLDVAAEHTSDATRSTFFERRARWGNEIRVVDVSVGNLIVRDEEHAEVVVQYAWTRMDEGVLRSTAITQFWENRRQSGWRLHREQRLAGDLGLFGEQPVNRFVHPQGDTHFPTRSLGSTL